jgi:hypothetical protein
MPRKGPPCHCEFASPTKAKLDQRMAAEARQALWSLRCGSLVRTLWCVEIPFRWKHLKNQVESKLLNNNINWAENSWGG